MSAKKTKEKLGSCKSSVRTSSVYLGEEGLYNYVGDNDLMINSIEQILAILQREHYSEKTSPFTSEVALNLDEYELKCTKGKTKRDNTVDFVVCLDKNKLLLVEAKLNVVNVENIRNIFDKISHSKDFLNVQPTSFSYHPDVVVLLGNDKFQQNSNRLRRMLIPRSMNVKPLRVSDFYVEYFKLD